MKRLLSAILFLAMLPLSHGLIEAYIGTEKTLPTLVLPYDIEIEELGLDVLILRIYARLPDEKTGDPRSMRLSVFAPLVRGGGPRANLGESRLARSVDLAVPAKSRPAVPHSITIKRSELAGAVLDMDFWNRSESHLIHYEIYLEDLLKIRRNPEANKRPDGTAAEAPPSNLSQGAAVPHP